MTDRFPRSFLVYDPPVTVAEVVGDILSGLTQEPTPFRASRFPTREEWLEHEAAFRRAEAERRDAEGRAATACAEAVDRLRAATSEEAFDRLMLDLYHDALRRGLPHPDAATVDKVTAYVTGDAIRIEVDDG